MRAYPFGRTAVSSAERPWTGQNGRQRVWSCRASERQRAQMNWGGNRCRGGRLRLGNAGEFAVSGSQARTPGHLSRA